MKKNFEWGKNHLALVITTCAVFVGISLFFIVIHPIVPYDGDDWLFFSHARHAVPMAGYWNASRVFQECLTPFQGLLSAFVVFPLTGDYIFSFTVTLAFILAFFVSAFHISMYKLFLAIVRKKGIALIGSFFVLLFFFGFFKTRYDSVYMLHGINYTCVLSYIIPALLNAILVCVLFRYQIKNIVISPKNIGYVKFGFLALFSYLAIFSMLFASLILTGYCAVFVLYSLIKNRKPEIKKNAFYFCVIAGFLVYCVFEMTGARAASDTIGTFALNESTGFFERIVLAIKTSGTLFAQINKVFLFFSAGLIVVGLVVSAVGKGGDKSIVLSLQLMFLVLIPGVYFAVMIVSAKAGALFYPQFIQVLFGVFFFYFLAAAVSLVYFLKSYSAALVVLPFAAVFFVNEVSNTNYRLADQMSYHWAEGQLPTRKKVELVNSWINEMKEADAAGLGEITLRVPKSPDIDDFPHPQSYWGIGFSGALFVHRITGRYITVKLDYVDGILQGNSWDQKAETNSE